MTKTRSYLNNWKIRILKLSFDYAQDGELVEPFRISNFVLRISHFNSTKRIIESHFIFTSFFCDVILVSLPLCLRKGIPHPKIDCKAPIISNLPPIKG